MCIKGVGVLEARIVRTMDDGTEWTANELRAEIGCSKQALTGVLSKLCEKGFVELYHPIDPRVRCLYRLIGRHPARR